MIGRVISKLAEAKNKNTNAMKVSGSQLSVSHSGKHS